MSRRRGSATALNASEVVAALAMPRTIYSYMGICQANFSARFDWGFLELSPRLAEASSPQKLTETCSRRSGRVCSVVSPHGYEANGEPPGHYRPAHRRATHSARRKLDHRHQRRQDRERDRRHAPAGLALDREIARRGREGPGPRAFWLPHRA